MSAVLLPPPGPAPLTRPGRRSDISWDFIRATFRSVSRTAIVSMQDVMSLDNSARMNVPGVAGGNWSWRIEDPNFFDNPYGQNLASRLRELSAIYERM